MRVRSRVLSPGSPTRPRRQKHLPRERRLRGGRGGPAGRHPRPRRARVRQVRMSTACAGRELITTLPRLGAEHRLGLGSLIFQGLASALDARYGRALTRRARLSRAVHAPAIRRRAGPARVFAVRPRQARGSSRLIAPTPTRRVGSGGPAEAGPYTLGRVDARVSKAAIVGGRAHAGGRERGAPPGAQASSVDKRLVPSTGWGCSRSGPAWHAGRRRLIAPTPSRRVGSGGPAEAGPYTQDV